MPIISKTHLFEEDIVLDFIGAVDERTLFPQTAGYRLSQRVVFNCEKMGSVSATAALTWSRWMKAQDDRQQFVFRHVPPRIIDLFNQIEGYLPTHVVVESFYAPYDCEHCGHEEHLLARRGHEYLEAIDGRDAQVLLPTEINCPKCMKGSKLAIWHNKFLSFLNAPTIG